MKAYIIVLMMAATLAIGTLSGCNDDPKGPSKEELFLKDLNGQWTLTAGRVTVGGKEVTNSFAGMEITFGTDKNYAVTNAVPPIWPASGTFTLEPGSNGLYDIRRSDNILITVAELTATSVTLQFQYASPSGRAHSLSGQYTFIMNR